MNLRIWKAGFAALIFAFCLGALRGQTELIVNGGFESGATGWSGATIGTFGRSGTRCAIFPARNTIDQIVTIPANATAATLRFYFELTKEGRTGDYLSARIVSVSANPDTLPLQTLMTITSYTQARGPGVGVWSSAAFDLMAYRGQSFRIVFATEISYDNFSAWAVDDVSLSVTTPAATPVLSVSPGTTSLGAPAGTGSIAISNSGGGSFNYSATSSQSWLAISSGGTGTNSGTVGLSFAANSGAQRTATVTIVADGAVGSPTIVTYTQAAAAIPVVTTSDPTSITTTSFAMAGNVTSDGGATITERGFVYSAFSTVPTTSDSKLVLGTGTGAFSGTITGLTAGKTYGVRAYATTGAGTGYGSAVIVYTVPLPPASVTFSNRQATSFTLAWSLVSGATRYAIDVATAADFSTMVPGYTDLSIGEAIATSITGLSAGTTYYCRVRAYNLGGAPSANSSTVAVTTVSPSKTPQTITFSAISSKTYGNAPLTLSATATSGLPVTFTLLSGPATLSGNQLTLTGVGTVAVRASQAGNATYDLATDVDRSFNVNKAPLTVTADAQTKIYGEANPSLTLSYSGFVNGDTVASVATPPVAATSATAASAVGIYTITVTGGTATNYSFTNRSGTLTVNRAPLTATADNKTMVAGGTVPALTVSYSGFVNGDSAAVVNPVPVVTTTATSSSPPGTYPIVAQNGVAANYTISYRDGTLTVTSAPSAPAFAASASTATFRANQPGSVAVSATGAPAPTYTVSGLPAWATFNSQTGTLAGTPPDSAVGSYSVTVTASNGTLPNATQTLALSVLPAQAPPAITSTATATFTAGVPGTFTVTATGLPQPTLQASQLPSWAAFDARTGVLSGTPPTSNGSPFIIGFTASNGVGVSAAQTFTLRVTDAAQPPVILAQPVERTVERGTTATFSVVAEGTGPLSYAWSRDGTAVGGNTATLQISNAQNGDAGLYTVQVSNSVGAVASEPAALRVNSRAAGEFFGEFAGGNGIWGLQLKETSGVFVAYLSATRSVIVQNLTVNADGSFVGTTPVQLTGLEMPSFAGSPGRAAAAAEWTISGSGTGSVVSGTCAGFSFSGAKDEPAGNTAGLYLAPALGTNASSLVVLRGSGTRSVAVWTSPAGADAASITSSSGNVRVTTLNNAQLDLRIDDQKVQGSLAGARMNVSFAGLPSAVPSTARLINMSVRGTAGGAEILTVGFATGGTGQKGVLVRGIGPTLGSFGVTNAITNPRLTLYDPAGNPLLSATGWLASMSPLFTRVGAFALAANSADAALAVTVTPGTQTLQLTNTAGRSGTGLIELYDTDGDTYTAKLTNASVRSSVVAGEPLIVGFVLAGNAPGTVLIRGIGPALTQFGVSGVLAAPVVTVYDSASAPQATNTRWGGTAALTAAFARVGAFPLSPGSADSALEITLLPGSYSVHLTGANISVGSGLLEIYDESR